MAGSATREFFLTLHGRQGRYLLIDKEHMAGIDPKRENEVRNNLNAAQFFHGCRSTEDVASISSKGFRGDVVDQDGRWERDGNLGKGIYLTCDWRTAVWFGHILLQATLTKGTRILDASLPADPRVIQSLKREFGHELVATGDMRKVLPNNKHLKLNELIELTRYFYHRVWDRDWTSEKSWKFSQSDKRELRALEHCVSCLKRYGFHGYGHPQDDNGIVMFAPDRIKLTKVVRALGLAEQGQLLEDGSLERMSLEQLAALRFPKKS